MSTKSAALEKEMKVRTAKPNKRLRFYRCLPLYLMFLPVLAYYILFNYVPMFGVAIAFKNYKVTRGFLGSAWCGLDNFRSFFDSIYAWRCIRNTLSISLLSLIFGFPAPIILALMMNEVRQKRFLKVVQTITYMPHFI